MENGKGYSPSEPISASERDTLPYVVSLVARSAVKAMGGSKRKADFVQILSDGLVQDTGKKVRGEFRFPLW